MRYSGAVSLPTVRDNPFDPPSDLGRFRAEEPLRRLVYPDGHVGWLVTSYGFARSILADPRFSARAELKRVPVPRPGADPFIGQPALPGWFVDMDPPDHTRLRRLLAREFTMRRMTQLRPRIEDTVAQHLLAIERRGAPTDLVSTFALPIPSVAICELLGVPYAEQHEFQRNSTTLFSLTASAEDGLVAMDWLTGFLLELIRHKRDKPGDDLLSGLAVGGELTDIELAGVGVLLLTAGHETVAGMLGLGAFVLLSRPDQLATLRTDPASIDNAIEELLRYLTIFHFGVPRTPLEDVDIGGRTVAAGESVTISLPAANRDPERFDDPDTLDITRKAGGHLAFGFGVHQCLGQNLARMEMRVAIPALFDWFPNLQLAVAERSVSLGTDMGFYGVHHLPVTW